MTVFIVRLGNCLELDNCLQVILDYLNKYKIKSYIMKEQIFNLHPSWYKLKAFDYVDDDFILAWDLDLLPKKNTPNITSFLNFEKINMAVDTSILLNIKNNKKYFRYNCGLMGIPKKYKPFCDTIFNHSLNKTPTIIDQNPSPTEQDIINEELYKSGFKDVNELDCRFNTLYYANKNNIKNILNSYFIHYTSSDLDSKHRNILTKKHYNSYFNLK